MDNKEETLEQRIASATRPITRDEKITQLPVTQGQLASVVAKIGGVMTTQNSILRAIMLDNRGEAVAAMDELDEGLLEIARALRSLVSAPESDA